MQIIAINWKKCITMNPLDNPSFLITERVHKRKRKQKKQERQSNESNEHLWEESTYWLKIFQKNGEREKEQCMGNSSVEIKHPDILQFKNIRMNSYIINGTMKLDKYKCPELTKNTCIIKANETYIGNFKGRKIDGYGKIISDKFLYQGHIKNWERNGKGSSTFFFTKCSHYDDDYIDQVREIRYNGMWVRNKRNGYGVLSIRFNSQRCHLPTYEGWWVQDKRHFYGVQYYTNSAYYGFWEKNKKCGFGKMFWFRKDTNEMRKIRRIITHVAGGKRICSENRDSRNYILVDKKILNEYIGEWKNDEMHGYGTYIWFSTEERKRKTIHENEDCDKYSGYWERGEKNGFGVFYFRCGDKYVGTWKNDKKHGLLYRIKSNGIILKCMYQNDEVISEQELNKTFKINHMYTNSLCNVINLGILKTSYSLTNKEIEHFYKIVYDHFKFLVNIYDLYRRKGRKKRYIHVGSTSRKKKIHDGVEDNNTNVDSFKLKNLWNMFYDANIINNNFTLSSLNKLVSDDTSIFQENVFSNLFFQNYICVDNFTLSEKEMVKTFFKSSNFLNEHFFFKLSPDVKESKWSRMYNIIHYISEGSHNKNIKKNDETEHVKLFHTRHNISGNVDEKNYAHDQKVCTFDEVATSTCSLSKDTHNLMMHIIFNKSLVLLNNFAKFYKYYWMKQSCCHMKDIKFILKKILLFLSRNKEKKGNSYLYYVLFSLFLSSIPMLYVFYRMNKMWGVPHRTPSTKGKENLSSADVDAKLMNPDSENELNALKEEKLFSPEEEETTCGTTPSNCCSRTQLNKLITLLTLNRYNIHDEKRKIPFNCFVRTLVSVSLHMHSSGSKGQTLVILFKKLKRYLWDEDEEKPGLRTHNIKNAPNKSKIKNKWFYNREMVKHSSQNCDKNREDNKNTTNEKNVSKTSEMHHHHHFIIPSVVDKREMRKNRQEEKNFNKKKKKNIAENNYPNCAICFYDYVTSNRLNKKNKIKCHSTVKEKSRNSGRSKFTSVEQGYKELTNILKNYVYYFIFYFLVFKSRGKKFSLFSTKLNMSIQLRDVLKFLFKLRLTKRDKTMRTKLTSINLASYHCNHYYDYKYHYDYHYHDNQCNYKARRRWWKMKSEKWKYINILTCAGKNKESVSDNVSTCMENSLRETTQKKEEKTKGETVESNNNSSNEVYIKSKLENKNAEGKKNYINNDNHIAHTASHFMRTYKKKKKKKKKINRMNRSGKKDNKKKKVLKKFSQMFCLPFFEVLSIFSKTLNTLNLHLINEPPSTQPCLVQQKKRKKIDKCRLKNHRIRYIMILKRGKKSFLVNFFKCTKRKACNHQRLVKRKKKGERKYPLPVHTNENENENEKNKKKNKILQELNEKLKQLELENSEQVRTNSSTSTCVQFEKKKKKNTNEDGKNGNCIKQILSDVEEHNELVQQKRGDSHIYIKRRSEIKIALSRLRRKYVHARKNYMSFLDYYNIYITPYELVLFFLKFVYVTKWKRGITSSYNDMLFFFIFHVLIHRTFRLALRTSSHGGNSIRKKTKVMKGTEKD
ncbi:hypothetical protein, conserved [Plasmodium gonderi]|uniref:MORN repeat protein n=1 Tax=Plasmodium gonderi TaxID=77519 RepID=A0A1Y1JGN2_PLAGO|nr:hypothetical protein, conserved [Plasmodium gonderi]GAW81410.1 hypothetical protein, conserved [Plasmodium gonderi]